MELRAVQIEMRRHTRGTRLSRPGKIQKTVVMRGKVPAKSRQINHKAQTNSVAVGIVIDGQIMDRVIVREKPRQKIHQ